ncbi:MAG: hypothetical protein FJ030_04275 [Chloroflexi bacterium]|nr:hypothetical protein [Chloroflexota bacterium]
MGILKSIPPSSFILFMFLPGYPPHPFPLSRHLPPLGEGIAAAYGEQFSAPGDVVIDTFGQTPRVALELARTGRRVIVANNNPILRIALRAALDPIPAKTLRAALTRLADSRLANDRLETYLRRVYRSICPDCKSAVEVDVFHWEKESLAEKSYYCESCHEEKTRPVDVADKELAARFPARGPHYHWAMDRIAPPDDPDRQLIADALEAYTPRALSVIFTITHKSNALNFDPLERRAIELLLLMAYDEGSSLEGARPRTLKPHVRFRERNIWLALERLARDEAWQSDGGPAVKFVSLAELLSDSSPAVVLHDGSIRDLAKAVPPKSAPCMITALPRPNLVLWTLSTAWAGWLWGEPSARAMRQLIRRRRYDWAWHENALRSGFSAAHPLLAKGSRLVTLLPEAEPGFAHAALMAADGANFTLIRHALRADPSEAQFVFQPDALAAESPNDLEAAIKARAEESAFAVLRERGEPTRWNILGGAIFISLARDHLLRAAVDEIVAEPLNFVTDTVETACLNSRRLVDLRADEHEGETVRAANVWWWLSFPGDAAPEPPFADRVEHAVARALAAALRAESDSAMIERRVCESFNGFSFPDGNLFRRCLESYGEEKDGLWRFRAEDNPMERAGDFERIVSNLGTLGRRLGYSVESKRSDEIVWQNPAVGSPAYIFNVSDSAEIARYVCLPAKGQAGPGGAHRVVVIPGGRAGLIDYKLKRDPRLRAAVAQGGWMFLKFRHVRRLLEEPMLDRADLLTVLSRDPIVEQSAAQLPLL